MSKERPRAITATAFARALADAGVIQDLDRITRIVIDVNPADVLKFYVEYIGDERMLKVAQSLDGIEISGVPAEAKP